LGLPTAELQAPLRRERSCRGASEATCFCVFLAERWQNCWARAIATLRKNTRIPVCSQRKKRSNGNRKYPSFRNWATLPAPAAPKATRGSTYNPWDAEPGKLRDSYIQATVPLRDRCVHSGCLRPFVFTRGGRTKQYVRRITTESGWRIRTDSENPGCALLHLQEACLA